MKTALALLAALGLGLSVAAQPNPSGNVTPDSKAAPPEKAGPVSKGTPESKTTPTGKAGKKAELVTTIEGKETGKATTPASKGAPGSKTAPADKAGKKEEPVPKIEGIEIARGDRGFLGVEIKNGGFRINFYDLKKKPVAPDIARAVLRWDAKYKVGQERVVLNPGEPFALSNPRTIRPPYTFKLFITLIKDAASEGAEAPVGESHVIDFRQ